MKKGIFALFILLATPSFAGDQPPYRIKNQPYINKNFEEIYFLMDTHNHQGEDSAQLNSPVIIGTPTVSTGGFYVKQSSTGVILKAEGGDCYAIRVSSGGSLFTIEVPCPS